MLFRSIDDVSAPALRRLSQVERFVLGLTRQHDYGAASIVFLGIGATIVSSLEDHDWETPNYHRSSECFEPECNDRTRELLNWLLGAANTLLLDGGLERVQKEFAAIIQTIPALSQIIGGGFIYNIYGLYLDPGRSLLREGIDVEKLSTWGTPPILYENFSNMKSAWFPADADTRQADESFARGQTSFGDRNYVDSATNFFVAAQSLDMKCETPICRDALWLWRAHAVWNAVTSLRQMKDPARACEEAKKFVVLAGDGHQKSSAADVEDALCGKIAEKPGQE